MWVKERYESRWVKQRYESEIQDLVREGGYESEIQNLVRHGDREIVLAAVGRFPWILAAVGRFTKDKDFVLAAVSKENVSVLEYADPVLKRDTDIVLAAVQKSPYALKYADPALQANRDIVLAAVQKSGLALQYADPVLRADRDIVLAAVQNYWHALPLHADPVFKADAGIVLAAVRCDGFALRIADPALQANRDIVLAAVQKSGLALQYADPVLRADADIVLAAVQERGPALQHADPALKTRRDIVLAAVQTAVQKSKSGSGLPDDPFGLALAYADPVLRADEDIVLAAVQQSGVALEYADPVLRANADIVLAAVQETGLALQYADRALQAKFLKEAGVGEDVGVPSRSWHKGVWEVERYAGALFRPLVLQVVEVQPIMRRELAATRGLTPKVELVSAFRVTLYSIGGAKTVVDCEENTTATLRRHFAYLWQEHPAKFRFVLNGRTGTHDCDVELMTSGQIMVTSVKRDVEKRGVPLFLRGGPRPL